MHQRALAQPASKAQVHSVQAALQAPPAAHVAPARPEEKRAMPVRVPPWVQLEAGEEEEEEGQEDRMRKKRGGRSRTEASEKREAGEIESGLHERD